MALGLGNKAVLGIGEESTYGTPVARAKFLELVSGGDGLTRVQPLLRTQSMYRLGVRGDLDVRQGPLSVEGPVTFEMPYDGAEKILKHAFGTVASSQPDAIGDPTVYQHIFTIADALPTGLTLEVDRDVTAFIYEGCKIGSLEFALDGVEAFLRLTANIVGEDINTGAATAQTLPGVAKFHAGQAVLKWNAVQLNVQNARITLDNALDAGRHFIGSLLRKEPLRGGKVRVEGSFTAEFDSADAYADFVAATSRVLTLVFTGPAIGAAAQTYKLTLAANVSKLTAYPVKATNEGRITVDVTFEGFRDGTDKELKATLINLTASPI